MLRRTGIVALVLFWGMPIAAAESPLAERLTSLVSGHTGKIAAAVKHLDTGEEFQYNADEVMPTASLIKLAVLVTAYRQVDEGKLDLARQLTLREEDKVPGSGVLSPHFSAGLQLSGPVQALQVSGQPILLNGHHLTIGRSVSQPGSLGNTVLAPGTVTRWFGTNTISEGNSAGSINFAVGTPASFQNRFVNISSSQITQGGTITLAHVEAAGQTNFDTPFFENLYGYVRRSNSYWELSTGNGFAAGELMLRLGAQGLQGNEPAPFVATNISLANGAAPGTFTTAVNFSTYPVVRRLLPGHTDLQQRFYIAERDPILPLNSLRLQGRLQQGIASLEWFTTGEQRLSHFEVERSNGSSFETIGRVTARNGHSQAYQFADAQPPRGSLLYRLRVVDQDGAFRYSPVLAMQHKDNQGWQLQQNYPNPARGTTRIAYQVAETAALSLQVLDTEGRQVQLLPLGRQQPGQYNVELNTCQLRPGIYRYRLLTSGMNTLTSLIQTMVVL